MSIGVRIASARKELGFSQAAFAKRVGVSLSSQKRYEKDERDPDTAYLSAISKAGVNIAFILTGEQQPDLSLELMGAHHVIDVIQTFLGFGKGCMAREFQEAAGAASRGSALFWKNPDQNGEEAERLDQALGALLQRSPALLDRWKLEDVIERVAFVEDARNLALTPRERARTVLAVYEKERATGRRLDFAQLETIAYQEP
jgi:transcriptional regulator with XRE-family HTH domain